MNVCSEAAGRYPSNYNAWSHRIWVLQHLGNLTVKVSHTIVNKVLKFPCLKKKKNTGLPSRSYDIDGKHHIKLAQVAKSVFKKQATYCSEYVLHFICQCRQVLLCRKEFSCPCTEFCVSVGTCYQWTSGTVWAEIKKGQLRIILLSLILNFLTENELIHDRYYFDNVISCFSTLIQLICGFRILNDYVKTAGISEKAY